jgi:hypothetical protein
VDIVYAYLFFVFGKWIPIWEYNRNSAQQIRRE